MKHKVLTLCLGLGMFASTAWAQNDVKLPQKPNRPAYTDHQLTDKGFWCAAELEGGSTVLLEKTNMQAVQLTYTAGYRLNEYLRVGVGFGGKYYVNNNSARRGTANEWTLPIFVNVRGNIMSQTDRSVVPYWSVNVGAAVNDGFFFAPTIGARFGEKRNSWLLGLTYSFNCLNQNHVPEGFAGPKAASSLSLHIGYEF